MSSATPNSAAKRPAGGGGTRLDEETFETLRDVLTSVALDSTPRSSTRGAIVRNTPAAATPNNHSSDNPQHSQGGGGSSSTAWCALEDDETDGEEERILRRTVGIDSPSRRHATVSAIQEQLAPLGIFPLELSMGVVCVPRGLPPPSDERSTTQQLTRRRVAKLEIVLATVGMKVAAQWYDPTPANPAASAKMSSSTAAPSVVPSYYPAVIRSFSGFYEGLSNLPDDSLSHFADFSVVEELSQRLPFLVAAVVVFDGDDVMSQAEAPVPTTGSTVTSSQVRRGVPLRLVWGQWGPSTTEGSRSSMAATTPTRSTTASSSTNQRSLTLFSPSNAIRTMRTPQPVTPSSHFTGSELMRLRPEELPQVLPLLSTVTATTTSSVAVDSTPSLRTVVMMGPAGLSPAPAGGASAADKYPITAADWVTRHVYRSRRFSIFTISEETELDARQEALRDLLFRWRRLRASCAVPPPAVPLTEALLKEQQEQEELHRQQQLLQQQRNNHSALPKPRVAALDASLSQSVDSPRSSVGQAQASANNHNTPQQPRNGDALRSPNNNNDSASRGRPSTARTLLTLEGIDQLPTAAALPKQQPTPPQPSQQQSEGSNEKNLAPSDPNKSSSPRQPKVVASPFVVKQTPLSAERDDEEPHPSFRGAEQPPQQQQQQQHSRAATKNVATPSEERDDLGSRPHDVVATRHRAISEETVDVSSGPPCLQGHRAMGNSRNSAGRHVAPAPLSQQQADPSSTLPQQRVATPGISRPSSSLPGPQHPVAQPVDNRTLTNRRSEPSTAHDRNHLDLPSSSSVALRKQEQHPQQARHQQHHQHQQVPSNTAVATSSLSEPALRMADPGGAVSQRPGSSSCRPLLRSDMAVAAASSGPSSSSTAAAGRGPSSHQPDSSAPLLYAAPPALRELQKPHPQPHHPQQRAAPMGAEEEDDAVVSEDSDDVKSHDTILESRSVSASRRDETHNGEEDEEEDVPGAMVSEAASPERYRQPVLRPHAYGGAAFARGTPTTTTAPTAASRRHNDTLSPAPGPRQEGPPKPTASTTSQSSSVVKRTVYAQIHSQRSTATHSTAPVARKGRTEEDWKPEGPKHAAGSDAHQQQHHPSDRSHESSVPRTAIALDYHYHRLVDASKYFGVDVPKARSSTTAKGTPPPPVSRSSQSSSSKQKVPSSKNIAAMALLQKRKEGAGAASTSRRPTTAESSVRSSRPQSPYALMVDIPTPTSSQQAAMTHRPQDARRPAGEAAVSQHPNHHHHHPAAHRSPPQSQSSYDFATAPPAQEVSMTSSAAAVYRPEPMRTLFRDRVESGRSRSPFEADDPSLRREVRISPLLQRKQQVIEDAAYVGKNAGPQRRSASPTQSSPQQSLASAPRANERRNSGSGPASSMPRTGSSSSRAAAPIQRENSGIIGLFDTPKPQPQYAVDRRRPVQQYAPQQQYNDPAAFDMPTLRTHPIQS